MASFLSPFRPGRSSPSTRRDRSKARYRPGCEGLEGRQMMAAGLGTDYTLMGGNWNNSTPISFSVAPDGVKWDQGVNDVNAKLNAEYGGTSWHHAIALALQTWAASSNLDFTPTTDSLNDFNVGGLAQGDPKFGDIRVGGYVFPYNTIAQTYGPPPNGSTAAGDVKLNTTYDFGPTGQYDLTTVLIHELGHSLGLGESPQPSSLMYSYYSGVRQSLSPYDVEGIQSIYGARALDSFQSLGRGTSAGSAVDLSSLLNPQGQVQVGQLGLASIGASEYFSVVAPSGQSMSLRVNAVAAGQSLMSPKVSVIDAGTGATLATDAHPDQYGDTATVSVSGVQPGHRYAIVVSGATSDVFSVGHYTLQVGFSGVAASSPVAAAPVSTTPVASVPTPTTVSVPTSSNPTPTTTTTTTTAQPVATSPYAANVSFETAAELGPIDGQRLVAGASLPSGNDMRVFAFEPSKPGLMFLASANTRMIVGDAMSRPIVMGQGLVGFVVPKAGARYYVILVSANNAPVADATFAVQNVAVAFPTPAATAAPVSSVVTSSNQLPAASTTTNSAPKKKKK